jgi:2-methylcitrate dehydratase PrpD
VLAAELAALDFTGARRILEGRQGFFAATAPDGDPTRVTAGLGNGWKLPGVSIKPYPSCRHTHSSVDAALRLRETHAIRPDDIDRVAIAAYHSVLDLADNPAPEHLYAAKFSVQYCVARALLGGALHLEDFTDERIREPDVRALMSRIEVRLDPALDARYPREFPADLSITLRDGRTVRELVGSPKGDPEAPLTPDELGAKFRGMLAGSAYQDKTNELLDRVMGLAGAESVRGLLALREWT